MNYIRGTIGALTLFLSTCALAHTASNLLLDLPEALRIRVLDHLELIDELNLKGVSKSLNELSSTDHFKEWTKTVLKTASKNKAALFKQMIESDYAKNLVFGDNPRLEDDNWPLLYKIILTAYCNLSRDVIGVLIRLPFKLEFDHFAKWGVLTDLGKEFSIFLRIATQTRSDIK